LRSSSKRISNIQDDDPRHELAQLTYQVHFKGTAVSAENIHARYLKDMKAALLAEQAKILDQGSHTYPNMAKVSAKEYDCLEILEGEHS
jgi:hypothetical protein